MKKILMILLASTLLFSTVLMGCNKPKDGLRKVTVVLDWVPNTNHTGLYTALEKGYYKAQGLDVEIIQPSQDSTIDVVAGGAADFGVSFQESLTMARTSKANMPVVAVAAIIQHNTSGFAARVSSGIKEPKDLEGRRYSGGSPLDMAFLDYMMKQDGADASKIVALNDYATDFFAATEGSLDFAWIYEGWDGIAAKVKNIPLTYFPLTDYGLDFYTPIIITSEDKIAKDPELVKKFMDATSKGYNDCVNSPDECAEYLLKHAPEIDRELALQSQRYLAKEYISDAAYWGEMKQNVWEKFSKFMYDYKMTDSMLDYSKAYTTEFLPK